MQCRTQLFVSIATIRAAAAAEAAFAAAVDAAVAAAAVAATVSAAVAAAVAAAEAVAAAAVAVAATVSAAIVSALVQLLVRNGRRSGHPHIHWLTRIRRSQELPSLQEEAIGACRPGGCDHGHTAAGDGRDTRVRLSKIRCYHCRCPPSADDAWPY